MGEEVKNRGSKGLAGMALEVGRPARSAALALVVVLAALPFGGCAGNVRVASLTPRPGGTFLFSARTNTVMTENADGAAEQIRRNWLADALLVSGTCRVGYVVDSRRFMQPPRGIFGNGGDIVYAGHCL
jgi:hypothetical protein